MEYISSRSHDGPTIGNRSCDLEGYRIGAGQRAEYLGRIDGMVFGETLAPTASAAAASCMRKPASARVADARHRPHRLLDQSAGRHANQHVGEPMCQQH